MPASEHERLPNDLPREGPGPEDPNFGGLVRAALQGVEPARGAMPPRSDEAALLAALEALEGLGRGDEDGAREVEGDPALRVLIAEVADALAAVDATRTASDERRLNPHVRSAVLAAFQSRGEMLEAPAPTPRTQGNGRAGRDAAHETSSPPVRLLRRVPTLVRIAALLLLGLGIAQLLAPGETASAGLWVRGMDRLSLAAGRPEGGSGRRLAVGTSFRPSAGELVALRLPFASTVVLEGGPATRADVVATASPPSPSDAASGARLRLLGGTALLQTGAGDPLEIEVGAGARARLRLERGEARVTVDTGTDGRMAVALRAGSELRVLGADGDETVRLVGPRLVEVERVGGVVRTVAEEAPARLFEPLGAFGHELPPPLGQRLVVPRRWRVLEGRVRRAGRRLSVRLRPGEVVRLAWQPDALAASAGEVELALPGARLGLETSVVVAGRPLAAGRIVEAGRARIVLPPAWQRTVGEREMVLVLTASASSPTLAFDFEGATFLPRPAKPAGPGGSAASAGGPGVHDDR